MKLQTLTVIFIIIMLPITMVVSQYIKTEISTINEQTQYDTRLNNSTYDAIKAFQINESNSGTSNISTEKIRDVEASVKTFYNSLASGMGVSGYNEEDLKHYIPCLAYVLYDGYYIYTSYTNSETGEKEYGLKPYAYFTEKIDEGNVNVTVSYTLDNYISVCGVVNGETVNYSGYLYTGNENGETEILKENIHYNGIRYWDVPYIYEKFGSQSIKFYYYNFDGTGNAWYSYGTDQKLKKESNQTYIQQLNTHKQGEYIVDNNALNYVIDNKKFSYWINENLGSKKDYLKISDDNNPDEYNSAFNEHRREVIKNSIKSNLEAAIINYKR